MKNSNGSNQCREKNRGARMRLRGKVRLVFASVVVCCLAATVGVSSASAASLYDSLVQSSLRNLATAVESEALVDGDYSSLTVSGVADWGWSPGADESTVIHIMDSGQGWWASMQDIRGSSEFIYQSSDYTGGSTTSVFKAQYQPAVAASVAGVSILGAGSELNAQVLAARLQSAGITASQICDELPFLPGTHRMESSATDETLACYAAVAAGAVTAAAIVHMLMQMGSSATLEALAIDLVGAVPVLLPSPRTARSRGSIAFPRTFRKMCGTLQDSPEGLLRFHLCFPFAERLQIVVYKRLAGMSRRQA
ncbi:MAG: hypothetical protein PUF51_05185 [Bifidobacteriaceae bacterium]|nr:hypothetical protein [Bifidobacteriaceae bacterium]